VTDSARVRWGFLGAGGIAHSSLGPAVHAADGAVLQAAAARDRARAAGLQPAGAAYDDYAALLADDEVDAVYISLANDAHRPWSIEALRAGKHVLCEKPLALTAAEVDEMAAVAARAGRLLVEASWYRWHPRVREAQRLLADGAIGEVRHVASTFCFDGVPDGNYRLEPQRGGGALYDVGCYAVSGVQWAFGGAPVREVVARQVTGATGVDLTTEAVLTLDSGEGEVRCSIAEPESQRLLVRGDSGEIELRAPSFTAHGEAPAELWVSDGSDTKRMSFAGGDAYRLMVEAMSRRVRGDDDAWVLPLAESRATAAILDAIRNSATGDGRPVTPDGGAAAAE
jgi:xylose dehydrogenase (NAD/NADP)